MLGAIFLVRLPHGFDVSSGGGEYALTQLLRAGGGSASVLAAEVVDMLSYTR
jgi:hypothetical protein